MKKIILLAGVIAVGGQFYLVGNSVAAEAFAKDNWAMEADGSAKVIYHEVCAATLDSKSKTISGLKDYLLLKAKHRAVSELFGEIVVTYTSDYAGNLVSETSTSSIGFLRTFGEPIFYNGKNLGEICVDTGFHVTQEDLKKFEPVQIVVDKFCFGDPSLSTYELMTKARGMVIRNELSKINPYLKNVTDQDMAGFARKIAVSNEDINVNGGAYCADYRFEMTPFEIENFVLGDASQKPGNGALRIDLIGLTVRPIDTPLRKEISRIGEKVRGVVIDDPKGNDTTRIGWGALNGKIIVSIREFDVKNSTPELRKLEAEPNPMSRRVGLINPEYRFVQVNTPNEFARQIRNRYDDGKFVVWLRLKEVGRGIPRDKIIPIRFK